MSKYKTYLKQMLTEHELELNAFKAIHDLYKTNKFLHQKEFNTHGKKIIEIILEYEKKLCAHMEKGNNAVFSTKLSEKYWEEVKKLFPLMDFVGAVIEKA